MAISRTIKFLACATLGLTWCNLSHQPLSAQTEAADISTQTAGKVVKPSKLETVDPTNKETSENNDDLTETKWNKWHDRIQDLVQDRIIDVSKHSGNRTFHNSGYTKVNFTVSKEMKVSDILLLDRCTNMSFNCCVLGVLKSLDGHKVFQFPDGANRNSMYVSLILYPWGINYNPKRFLNGKSDVLYGYDAF